MADLSIERLARLLEEHLSVIYEMGDEDECSSKHIGYSLAAIVADNTWRDGVDYRDPSCANVFNIEWPARFEGRAISAEELIGLVEFQERDPAQQAPLQTLLADPEYVAKGRQLIEEWKQKLTSEWEAVEALYHQVGKVRFIEAIQTIPICDYFDYALD
jgi:hypothetical protein